TAFITGTEPTINISGGTNKLFLTGKNTVVSNGDNVFLEGTGTFNITGDVGTIRNTELVTVNTVGNVTANDNTAVNVTGRTVNSVSVVGRSATTNIDIETGIIYFSGNYFDSNTLTTNSGQIYATGQNFDIIYSESIYATGGGISVRDSTGTFYSDGNLYATTSDITFTSGVSGNIYISGGTNTLTTGSAIVSGDLNITDGGNASVVMTGAQHISFDQSTGTITTNSGSIFVTGSEVNLSGNINYVTGGQIYITSGYSVFTGTGISITGGTNTVTVESGIDLYITDGVSAVVVKSGDVSITGGTNTSYNQIFNESGGVMYVTGETNWISGSAIQSVTGTQVVISGVQANSYGAANVVSQLITPDAEIHRSDVSISSSSGITVAEGATIHVIQNNEIDNFSVIGGTPRIIKGTNIFNALTGYVTIEGSEVTNITGVTSGGHVGFTGETVAVNVTGGTLNITGDNYTIISTGGISYITGGAINLTGSQNFVTGFVTINNGFITGSTVTITGDGNTYVSGGEIVVRSVNTQINSLTDSTLNSLGTAIIEDSDVSMLSVGATYVTGNEITMSSRPGSDTYITGGNIDLDNYGTIVIQDSSLDASTETTYVTSGISSITGNISYITGGVSYVTGRVYITGGENNV
ncbi:MAG: hypothetical protein QF535_04985, partial [Anaerolineales bacterium]|nr:hypothetical protein [Anaerolineales bacterium]